MSTSLLQHLHKTLRTEPARSHDEGSEGQFHPSASQVWIPAQHVSSLSTLCATQACQGPKARARKAPAKDAHMRVSCRTRQLVSMLDSPGCCAAPSTKRNPQ